MERQLYVDVLTRNEADTAMRRAKRQGWTDVKSKTDPVTRKIVVMGFPPPESAPPPQRATVIPVDPQRIEKAVKAAVADLNSKPEKAPAKRKKAPTGTRNNAPDWKGQVQWRQAGKNGLGVHATWALLFAENEKAAAKKTDEELTAAMQANFPGRTSAVFAAVGSARRKYNLGKFTKGVRPNPVSTKKG